jgi:putative transposase
LIEPDHPRISISRQCELLGLARSGFYYEPLGMSPLNLELMRSIDEIYTRSPFYGSPRITATLKERGYSINHKRVERLMNLMGLQAVQPRRNLSQPAEGHKKYPYLLRDLIICEPEQVWASDITYIRLKSGFVYLVAVMDWFSRYVLSWRLSTSMEYHFCIEALQEALQKGKPGIFNTDQGSQFTSEAFTGALETQGIRISMDGRGRAMDNIMIERLWRSVKYEEVYLKDYESVMDARSQLREYFQFYNQERLHQSLGYRTPKAIHDGVRLSLSQEPTKDSSPSAFQP